MIIKKLNCGNKNDSYVTVQLNYDEVRDIANTCYYATEFIPADQTKIRSNAGIAANMTKFLFDMAIFSLKQFKICIWLSLMRIKINQRRIVDYDV